MEKQAFNPVEFIKKHRVISIISGAGVVALIVVLALVLAMCNPGSDPVGSSKVSGVNSTNESEGGLFESESGRETDSQGNPISSVNSSGGNTTGDNNPGGTGEVVNNCYVNGRKIAENTITFKIMIRDHYAGQAKYNDSAFAKYVLDNFNIKLVFELVSAEAVGEKMTLALASKTLPDMFWGMAGTANACSPYIDAGGYIKEVSQYLNKFGSNINKMFQERPEAKYSGTYEDGKMYMIPMYQDMDNFSWTYFINKTWLSNLKLSMPTTTDQLYDVLMAFKTQDANKNGNPNDEIPLMLPVGSVIAVIPQSLFSPFGVYSHHDGWCLDQATNKVQFGYITDEYRTGLRYYKKLYDAGLVTGDRYSTTFDVVKGRTGGSVQTCGMFAANGYSDCVTDKSYSANYTLLPPLTDNPSRSANWINTPYENLWTDWCIISEKCQYPEAAVRLIDWLYTMEGTLTARFGPSGEGLWKYDSGGKIIANKKVDTKTLTPGYPIPHYYSAAVYDVFIKNINAPFLTPAEKAYQSQLQSMYLSKPKVKTLPKLQFTKSELDEISSLDLGSFTTYAHQIQWDFISGTKSLDNDWAGYLSQMKKLGSETYAEYMQRAYNRYKAFMKNQ